MRCLGFIYCNLFGTSFILRMNNFIVMTALPETRESVSLAHGVLAAATWFRVLRFHSESSFLSCGQNVFCRCTALTITECILRKTLGRVELGFKVLHLLLAVVAGMVGGRGDGVGGGRGDNGRTGDLGDGVAVLNLNGDLDDLGVANAVLGGDLTAS